MELNLDAFGYLSKDDFRVLTAVELGIRNHDIVPVHLIDRIANLKHGGTHKVLKNLLMYKLLSIIDDGYRLTYLGYDFLAIKTMVNRGVFAAVGRKIGTGKESVIFEVATEDGTVLAMKLHRLSFRAEPGYLDYNWLSSSRLAALKEFAFMKALEDRGFPVPRVIDHNRHCIVMSLVDGCQLKQVKELQNPAVVFEKTVGLVVRLAEHGLIHCDFNDFNIMIGDDENITMVDFPQMVPVSHHNAHMYFDRDIDCISKFFSRRFNMSLGGNSDGVVMPRFADIKKDSGFLDRKVAASGIITEDQADIKKEENNHHIQPSNPFNRRKRN